MTEQELFYPVAAIRIGEYVFDQGIAWSICSDIRDLADWGKLRLTKEFQNNITINPEEEVTVYQGYGTQLKQTFRGIVVKAYNNAAGENEILFKDMSYRMEKVIINHTFLHVTPQELIRYGLSAAGITDYYLADTAYQAKTRIPVMRQRLPAVLKLVENMWELQDVNKGFVNGTFYWGTWPETEIAEFVYGYNVISLNRTNGLWELETVCQPDIQVGQNISITHPKVSGTYRVIRIVTAMSDKGFIRCRLYF